MVPEDFETDPMREPLQRIYDLIQPEKVTTMLGTEKILPWQET